MRERSPQALLCLRCGGSGTRAVDSQARGWLRLFASLTDGRRGARGVELGDFDASSTIVELEVGKRPRRERRLRFSLPTRARTRVKGRRRAPKPLTTGARARTGTAMNSRMRRTRTSSRSRTALRATETAEAVGDG